MHNTIIIVGKHHAKHAEFINCIQTEQSCTDVIITQMNAGRAVGNKKRRKYCDYEARILNVVDQYNKRKLVQYLCNISFNVTL